MATWSLYEVGLVDKLAEGKCGGIFFSLVGVDEEFFLLDDNMANSLKERIIPKVDGICKESITLQSIADASAILKTAKQEGTYVCVNVGELFGIRLFRLELSPVPGYALDAYKNSDESEKAVIKHFTDFASENKEFYDAGYGKYIAIINGQVIRTFFNSPSEMKKQLPEDKVIFFCLGIMVKESSGRFFRCMSPGLHTRC